MVYLFLMHVAGADRTNEALCSPNPDGEGEEHIPPATAFSDGRKAFLGLGVFAVLKHGNVPTEKRLDLRDRNAVLLAFRAIAPVPGES